MTEQEEEAMGIFFPCNKGSLKRFYASKADKAKCEKVLTCIACRQDKNVIRLYLQKVC